MDYDDIRNGSGKTYKLDFLPYIETRDGRDADSVIGYATGLRGSLEEFFRTLPEARERMDFLTGTGIVEKIQLRKEIPGSGWATTLVDEWSAA